MDSKFTQKARLVLDGHKVQVPPSITYYSIVSSDRIRIALLVTFLDNLEICTYDFRNVYLSAMFRGNWYTISTPPFDTLF